MSTHAAGSFDVKLTPQPLADTAADKSLGRMSVDKEYHGDLEGTSRGQMLTGGTPIKNSAGYVAREDRRSRPRLIFFLSPQDGSISSGRDDR